MLLDLGQGSFARLADTLDPATLDAVVISHLHPDHFIDLVALRHYLRWEKPRRRVRVIGPAGLDERLDALHGEPGFSAASLDVEPLHEGTFTVASFEIQAARVTHTQSSFGFRVSTRDAATLPGSSTRVTAVGPRTSMSWPAPATRCCARSRSGPARSCPAPGTSTGRRSATWRPACAPAASCSPTSRWATTATPRSRASRARFDGPVELVDPGYETAIPA